MVTGPTGLSSLILRTSPTICLIVSATENLTSASIVREIAIHGPYSYSRRYNSCATLLILSTVQERTHILGMNPYSSEAKPFKIDLLGCFHVLHAICLEFVIAAFLPKLDRVLACA